MTGAAGLSTNTTAWLASKSFATNACYKRVIGPEENRAMALSEFETKRVEKLASAYIDRVRPPAHIRDQVDLAFRISDQSLELFEIRPLWNDPSTKIEESQAKTTYVKKSSVWKIYWMRADLKWHGYEPVPEVVMLEEFFEIVEEDTYGCFKG